MKKNRYELSHISISLPWFKAMQLRCLVLLLSLFFAARSLAQNEQTDQPQKSLEVYGFAMVDMGYNADQIDPRWSDALRINRLP
ncbi:MAG TPA: hypothetical protein VFL47_01160, partial [Flavisolibacter sp.]|nr:hypothetical protein [Flavisolibacter sp.]